METSKTLHSLRHTFNDELKQNGVNEEYRSELSGHSVASINSSTYTNKLRLPLMLQALSVLKFDLAGLRYDRDKVMRFLVKDRAAKARRAAEAKRKAEEEAKKAAAN